MNINPSEIKISETELHFDFINASGPGGQNVNKVATAVQLRFDVRNSPSLDIEVKERMAKLAGSRMTENGVLILVAKRYRSQEKNRLDAIQRLKNLIQKALIKPRLRRATRPSLTARAARVDNKKKRGEVKRIRRNNPGDWE